MKLYQAIAQNWRLLDHDQPTIREAAAARQVRILDRLPKGSGFDNGTHIEKCDSQTLVLRTAFHHMDTHGNYCGWSGHKIQVKADLLTGVTVHVGGVNRRGIKEFIGDTFRYCMGVEFEWR